MQSQVAEVAQKLARETASWGSIDARVRQTRLVNPKLANAGPGLSHIETRMIEQSGGKRFLSTRGVSQTGAFGETLLYSDGSRCAALDFSKKAAEAVARPLDIVIGRRFGHEEQWGWTERPLPFRSWYVGLEPLYRKIADAKPYGVATVAGRVCDGYLFEGFRPAKNVQDLVYYLDRETSVPLKVVAYTEPRRLVSGKPQWVWEAKSLGEVAGFHVVKASTYTGYSYKGDEPGEVSIGDTIAVEALTFDQAHGSATFWPASLPPGGNVIDTLKNENYVVPDPAAKIADVMVGEIAVAPIPVDWASHFATIGAGLSITLLVTGAALWWRHRVR